MKFLVVLTLSLVAFVAADEEWKPIADKTVFLKIRDDCMKELGMRGRVDEESTNAAHEMEMLGILCVVKKLGVFSEDKGYDLERVMKLFDALLEDGKKMRDIVVSCIDSNEQKSSPQEWAFRGHQCFTTDKNGNFRDFGKLKRS